MSWSYSGNPSSSALDQLRFLIGDTNSADPLLSNEELNWIIGNEPDIYSAAISAVIRLISQASRSASTTKKVGDLSLTKNDGQKVAQWEAMLAQLRSERMGHLVAAPVVNSNSLIRTIDRDTTDVPGTDFALGQMDNN